MKILLIGSGGREHALAWKLKKDGAKDIIAAPGNAGIAQIARCEDVKADDVDALVDLAKRETPDLVVIGPEAPLAMGLADKLSDEKIPVFGPSANAARIESSKVFAKELMEREGIPTAAFQVFDDFNDMRAFLRNEGKGLPWVVKADGLAAGKGSIVCPDSFKAQFWGNEMLVQKRFGDAGKRIVLEEMLEGREASILFLCDSEDFFALPIAQDYKRAEDDDKGKNTGGMGAFAPATHVTPEMLSDVENQIVAPTLAALQRDGNPFQGVLYVGLMLTADGPKVIEFNCRFGDPETQVILPVWPGNLPEALFACAEGHLKDISNPDPDSAAVCVVLAAKGYPEEYKKGYRLRFPKKKIEDTLTFHAGTQMTEDGIVSSGGRV
ncbi:phosphoribosylamine--glycine ligase, partial [bacterium]|nr:phosphoribosylamine--glycine ligase [bacterium]